MVCPLLLNVWEPAKVVDQFLVMFQLMLDDANVLHGQAVSFGYQQNSDVSISADEPQWKDLTGQLGLPMTTWCQDHEPFRLDQPISPLHLIS